MEDSLDAESYLTKGFEVSSVIEDIVSRTCSFRKNEYLQCIHMYLNKHPVEFVRVFVGSFSNFHYTVHVLQIINPIFLILLLYYEIEAWIDSGISVCNVDILRISCVERVTHLEVTYA